jgi:hypothetical protein
MTPPPIDPMDNLLEPRNHHLDDPDFLANISPDAGGHVEHPSAALDFGMRHGQPIRGAAQFVFHTGPAREPKMPNTKIDSITLSVKSRIEKRPYNVKNELAVHRDWRSAFKKSTTLSNWINARCSVTIGPRCGCTNISVPNFLYPWLDGPGSCRFGSFPRPARPMSCRASNDKFVPRPICCRPAANLFCSSIAKSVHRLR